jgi:hypothetical protein
MKRDVLFSREMGVVRLLEGVDGLCSGVRDGSFACPGWVLSCLFVCAAVRFILVSSCVTERCLREVRELSESE